MGIEATGMRPTDDGYSLGAAVSRDVAATSTRGVPVAARAFPPSLRLSERETNPRAATGRHRLRVIVADDHELARKGLVALLGQRGICVVAEARSAADAMSQAVKCAPDVLITDLCMPGMSAIEATQRLAAIAPDVRVLVLTGVTDDSHVIAALLAGACGYLLKTASIDQIVDGITAAAQGDSPFSPAIATRLLRRLREPNLTIAQTHGVELTARELEVLQLVARGSDNRCIAETLHLSEYTVKQYVSSILDKLQVGNRIQAAVRAVRCGLV